MKDIVSYAYYIQGCCIEYSCLLMRLQDHRCLALVSARCKHQRNNCHFVLAWRTLLDVSHNWHGGFKQGLKIIFPPQVCMHGGSYLPLKYFWAYIPLKYAWGSYLPFAVKILMDKYMILCTYFKGNMTLLIYFRGIYDPLYILQGQIWSWYILPGHIWANKYFRGIYDHLHILQQQIWTLTP